MALLPTLPPNFEAALRDVKAHGLEARLQAAQRLADPPADRAAEARRALEGMAQDAVARVRVEAIKSLAELADPQAVPGLLEALEDPAPRVREWALLALGEMEGPEAQEAVSQALRSPHPELRFQALAALSQQPESTPRLLPLLRDADPEVRAQAASAVRQPAPKHKRRVLATLVKHLNDPDPDVRSEVALSLAMLGDGRAAQSLCDCLHDPDRVYDALEALGRVGDRAQADAVAALCEGLLRPLILQAAAARALHRMGDSRGASVLQRVLRALRRDGRNYAVEIVAELKIEALLPELCALAARPRGADPVVVAQALSDFLPHPQAGAALAKVAERSDEAGHIARKAIVQAGEISP